MSQQSAFRVVDVIEDGRVRVLAGPTPWTAELRALRGNNRLGVVDVDGTRVCVEIIKIAPERVPLVQFVDVAHTRLARTFCRSRSGDGVTLCGELLAGVPLGDVVDALGKARGELPIETCLVVARDLARLLALHDNLAQSSFSLVTSLVFGWDGSVQLAPWPRDGDGRSLRRFAWLAPEHAQALPITSATATHQVGHVLYALLAGKPAFEGKSDVALLDAVRDAMPRMPTRALPDVVKMMLEQALRKNPRMRWKLAKLAAALDDALASSSSTDESAQVLAGFLGDAFAGRKRAQLEWLEQLQIAPLDDVARR